MDWVSFPAQTKSHVTVCMGNCLAILAQHKATGVFYDAIVTDPPYEVGLHGKAWDQTGISFSRELWQLLFAVLKPGGFIVAFSAPRLYHRLAVAAEDVGFTMYPFLSWQFHGGVPKPANVSELLDRDVLTDREIIGYRVGSGFSVQANINKTKSPVYARCVSPEAKQWRGFYYGVNCLMPCVEPILLAQKPIDQPRTIDNLRKWRTGALNLGALKEQYGKWPETVLRHDKARKSDHQSDHPSVKPISLMADLCTLICPPGGVILDPFAGTGSTGVAAQNLGFACTLIECDTAMQTVINRRLNSL